MKLLTRTVGNIIEWLYFMGVFTNVSNADWKEIFEKNVLSNIFGILMYSPRDCCKTYQILKWIYKIYISDTKIFKYVANVNKSHEIWLRFEVINYSNSCGKHVEKNDRKWELNMRIPGQGICFVNAKFGSSQYDKQK